MDKIENSYELMRKLTEYTKTLGWELVEWNWVDGGHGTDEFQIWVKPDESD